MIIPSIKCRVMEEHLVTVTVLLYRTYEVMKAKAVQKQYLREANWL